MTYHSRMAIDFIELKEIQTKNETNTQNTNKHSKQTK